jgi:hypothetical protein
MKVTIEGQLKNGPHVLIVVALTGDGQQTSEITMRAVPEYPIGVVGLKSTQTRHNYALTTLNDAIEMIERLIKDLPNLAEKNVRVINMPSRGLQVGRDRFHP